MMAMSDFLASIREQNLRAYQAMPSRVREDVAQESQIAQDYRGRLVYELLQNADDAMVDQGALGDRIVFRLTDDELVVGNSGRTLTRDDVSGLCGTGASTKGEVQDRRRASIGHKGMGFKSVLEVTERPEVVSEAYAFRLDAKLTRPAVDDALRAVGQEAPKRVPTMRLPWPDPDHQRVWADVREQGLAVQFRFPLRTALTREQRDLLADRLLGLPVSAILFLKHLETVEVDVETSNRSGHFKWEIRRELTRDDSRTKVPGFVESGTYHVSIGADDGREWDFVVAHEGDVVIGEHRGGLDDAAWEGIEFTEVSIAAPWPPKTETGLPFDWARFHVFLPTGERSPYPMLLNGAFKTDLSRQELRVGEDRLDYNRHLLHACARVFRDRMLPALLEDGGTTADVLALLDRPEGSKLSAQQDAAAIVHEAMRRELADLPFIDGEGGLRLSLAESVVPPLSSDPTLGQEFRLLLAEDATFQGRWFPTAELCGGANARVLVDLGAAALDPGPAAEALAAADGDRSRMQTDAVYQVQVDPVLAILQGLWRSYSSVDRSELERAVRGLALFPVGVDQEGRLKRVVTTDVSCFYPPQYLTGEVPLHGLQFMLQALCWGNLSRRERGDALGDRMTVWQGLFDVREFKFPDVMRASVLPGLELDPSAESAVLRAGLTSMDHLAAICQLAGRTANASAPLPFERLGPNRAVFNLSRLRVPCREDRDGVAYWEPAYRVYFGRDWIGDQSIELVFDALRDAGLEPPSIPLLAPPSEFQGQLDQFRHLEGATADEVQDAEVGLEEDEEAALETDERDRWIAFLTWLGVNRVLRPVAFHDVEDRGSGWLSTKGLSRPEGHAFRGLEGIWDQYVAHVRSKLSPVDQTGAVPYFFRLHDLDHLGPLLRQVKADPTTRIGQSLYLHLARGWQRLESFAALQLAVVPDGRTPGMRTKPPHPMDDELRLPAEDFWVHRMRRVGWLPSSLGPRMASRVWLPSSEIDRRFGRRGSVAGDLLPLLDVDEDARRGRAAGLAHALGIREQFAPATFRVSDAKGLLERIAARYTSSAESGDLNERTLREVVRPAYRNMIELLAGVVGEEGDRSGKIAPALGDEPVLVSDGHGRFRFVPGREAMYIARGGTRERLGGARLEAFVIEGSLTARLPLALLGIRTLEDELQWTAKPGASALEDGELERFHSGLRELAPFVLARLQAERADDDSAARDLRRLRAMLGSIEPVESLELECSLDGRIILRSAARDSFVDPSATTALICWGNAGWPPASREADALASLMVDLFGAGAFEAFLALIRAETPDARMRLLHLAGAPTDIDHFRNVIANDGERTEDEEDATDAIERTASQEGEEWTQAPAPLDTGAPGDFRVPLYRAEELLIAGVPVEVRGRASAGGGSEGRTDRDPGDRGGSGGAIATDLDELNALGMFVALTFEVHRLHLEGREDAVVFSADSDEVAACVFDVSTPRAIETAWQSSTSFRKVIEFLESHGLQRSFPGFDILTLNPETSAVERLIELKSSGVNARVQSMTWNEWKTAKASALRELFYLYLVGNLRNDLADALPYLRAIHDPFGSLWGQEVVEAAVHRTVQLRVDEFETADEISLGVRPRKEIDRVDPA
jgi:hypothetical protein